MKKLSYLFIALFISACQAEPDFTEEVTPLLHTRAGSLQFAQTDNLNLDALGIVHPTKIVRKDSLYVILTPQSAYRFAIYNHLNGTLHHLVAAVICFGAMVEIDFNQTAGAEIQCRNDIAVEVEVQVAVPFAFAASRRY